MALIPFDDRDGFIWWDGSLIDWREAKLHVLTHGLHYGSAVFEGERSYAGNIFKLREHTDRLIASAGIMGFKIPYSAEQIDAACVETLAANGLTEGYVRPLAWRGSEQLSVSAQQSAIHLMVAVWPWPNLFGHDYMKGIRLGMAEWRRPPPSAAPTAAKASGLYMTSTLAKHQAEEQGLNDALMLDWRGLVAEATGANIFLVIDGKLHTPTPDCFLDGITRRTVMSIARRHQMTVIERAIPETDLARASEAFLAGTAAEVTPIRAIGDHHYEPGRITKTLVEAYTVLSRQSPAEVERHG